MEKEREHGPFASIVERVEPDMTGGRYLKRIDRRPCTFCGFPVQGRHGKSLPTPQEAALVAAKFVPGWAVIVVATLGKFAEAYAIFRITVRLRGFSPGAGPACEVMDRFGAQPSSSPPHPGVSG